MQRKKEMVVAAKDQGRAQTPSVYNYDWHLARRTYIHLLIVSHLSGYFFSSSLLHIHPPPHFKTVLRTIFRSIGHISLMASRSVPPLHGPRYIILYTLYQSSSAAIDAAADNGRPAIMSSSHDTRSTALI